MTTAAKKPKLEGDGRDPKTEQWLTSLGVDFTYEPKLPIADIDRARSLANQARIEPLDQEVVDRYTADYQRGDQFPPVLAHRTSNRAKRLVLLGGNHRITGAANAKKRTHPAYIVTGLDPATAHALSYGDNRRHGLPPSTTERLAQAVHLVNMGWTAQKAAEACGVHATGISAHQKAQEGAQRARQLDVDGFDRLPAGHRTRLARIQADPVFAAATSLTVDAHLTQGEVDQLVRNLGAARSETQALKVIGSAREDHEHAIRHAAAGKKPRPGGATGYDRLRHALDQIGAVDQAALVRSIPNDDVAKVLVRKILDTTKRLRELGQAVADR